MTFDTETMAELHASQGRNREALAIYRRLLAATSDDEIRARRQRRIVELEEGRPAPAKPAEAESAGPTKAPLLGLSRQGQQLRIEWAIAGGGAASEIELLLITRTPEGVVTRPLTIALSTPRGCQLVEAVGLHSARAALGRRIDGMFVPSLRASLAG